MAININLEKKDNENSMSILRRFRNRVKSSGILNKVRKDRYWSRNISSYTQKKGKLRKLDRSQRYEKLVKMGKITE